MTEFFQKLGADIAIHTYEHIYLTFISLTLAVIIAVPLGIFIAKSQSRKLASIVMGMANLIQTIPSLALLAFMITIFLLINRLYGGPEWYKAGGLLPTIGTLPAVVALVLYALLPILRNTYTGIRQVEPSIVEVARGMGMTRRQILIRVELPLSLPFIMSGVRISTVWTIGIATLCGLVGAGGLGDLIMQGLRSNQLDYLIAGTVPAAVLALLLDAVMGLVEKWLTPDGMKTGQSNST